MENEKFWNDLKEALARGVKGLTPVAFDHFLRNNGRYLSGEEMNGTLFRTLLETYLAEAETFEIHCWKEEEGAIGKVLSFAREMEGENPLIFCGEVTEEFSEMVSQTSGDGMKEYTPFFNLFLNNGFQSAHYGDEVYLEKKSLFQGSKRAGR